VKFAVTDVQANLQIIQHHIAIKYTVK